MMTVCFVTPTKKKNQKNNKGLSCNAHYTPLHTWFNLTILDILDTWHTKCAM